MQSGRAVFSLSFHLLQTDFSRLFVRRVDAYERLDGCWRGMLCYNVRNSETWLDRWVRLSTAKHVNSHACHVQAETIHVVCPTDHFSVTRSERNNTPYA